MTKKYKMTGCARFLIFLVVFVPLVYFGVSYFRGENPIEPIKQVIPESWGKDKSESSGTISEDAILDGKIKTLEQTNESLRKEVNELKSTIRSQEEEIRRLKTGGN